MTDAANWPPAVMRWKPVANGKQMGEGTEVNTPTPAEPKNCGPTSDD
jgi:hypothetical protein